MVDQLPTGTIRQDHALVAVRQNSNGTHTLTFDHRRPHRSTSSPTRCVLALPFTALKLVDLRRSGLSPLKRKAIATRSSRLATPRSTSSSRRKTWPALGYSGGTFTEYDGFCARLGRQRAARAARPRRRSCSAFPAATGRRDTLDRCRARPRPGRRRRVVPRPGRHGLSGDDTAAWTGTTCEDHSVAGPVASRARTPTGASGRRPLRAAPKASPKGACTSPASTPTPTSRASSTAPSSPVSAPAGRSSPR